MDTSPTQTSAPGAPGAPSKPSEPGEPPDHPPFWTRSLEALCAQLACGREGLGADEAARRLTQYGRNSDTPAATRHLLGALGRRLLEPLSLILLFAGLVSLLTGETIGGLIIVVILSISIGLDTFQEGHAAKAAEALRRSVALKAEVRRDGDFIQVDVDTVVPGDLMRVRAGDIIAADALILQSNAFTAGEAALTGEPYPVEKHAGAANGPGAAQAGNTVFRGAVAQTGEALALVVGTGRDTVFGAAASVVAQQQQPSPFQRDLREFGLVTARLTLALVVIVLALRVLLGRPVLDSLMFAVALAVGLTPELLPMITTVTLSRGALRMSRLKVIVKRLASIHDLGAMTVLCTDKTGTLTEARIRLARSSAPDGSVDPRAARLGAIAAALAGDRGSLDAALTQAANEEANEHTGGWTLLARHSFDFNRRVGSALVDGPQGPLLIVKGAPEAVLALCTQQRRGASTNPDANATPDENADATTEAIALDDAARDAVLRQVRDGAADGLRSIAIASRAGRDAQESALVFEGLCAFADPPKASAAAAIARLARAGIRLKVLSGDDPMVVRRLAAHVGLPDQAVLSGDEVAALSDEALAVTVRKVDLYGRLAPDQKARIVKALQAHGALVGYLGDGINDAPALRVADVGLSVADATGVAQACADIILLDSDLGVVADGVAEGRRTFANILKYVRMGASSNVGNMLSMALASIALPFLPMLPIQILLNNMLYDLSEIGIPFDRVRARAVARPQVWDMRHLVRFAAVMGPLSSVFDMLTFALLLYVYDATPGQFQTAWFLESMATQILVIFMIRTNVRAWHDRPHPILIATTLAALALAVLLPFSAIGHWFGFVPPPPAMLAGLVGVVFAYLLCVELFKPLALGMRRHR